MNKPILALLLCACGSEINAVDTKPVSPAPEPQKYSGHSAPLTSPCDFDAAAVRGVLAGSTQREAFLVRSDGTRVTLVSASGNQSWVAPPVVRGGFVLVGSTRIESGRYVSRLQLFESSGAELASLEGVADGELSADGFVATRAPAGGLLVLGPDGSTFEEPGLTVAGAFGKRGLLPVWRNGDTTARRLGLLDVRTHEHQEIETPLFGWSSPVWSNDVLVFLGQRDGQPLVARHQGGLTLTTPIAGALTGGLEIEQVTESAAVLVSGAWVQVRLRVDLTTGELTPLAVEPPEGVVFAGRHSASLADDGSLVAAFNKAGVAGLFRSLDGKRWEPMGGGVKDATFIRFAGKNGTWLMSAAGALGWASSTTVGMIPSMQRAVTLPAMVNSLPTPDAVSADGRCAAVWTGSGTQFSLVAVDLVRGTEKTLASSAVRPASAVWLR